MREFRDKIQLFSEGEIQQIHAASLAILANPGMRIESRQLRQALKAAGAQVDEGSRVVRFPANLVENTLEEMKAALRGGKNVTRTAARQVEKIMARENLYEADKATIRAIDQVVSAAEEELCK